MNHANDACLPIVPVHADDALLVFEKPAGLLAVPGRGADKQDCLSARAQERYPDARIAHRLDMATSGLMLMARGAAAQRSLNRAFAERRVDKRYVAVVDGLMDPPADSDDGWGNIDLPIRLDWPNRPRRTVDPDQGKPSLTRWRVLEHDTRDRSTRVELEPVTGRSHQLRVHLSALGHPILGDALYAPPLVRARAARLLLHAWAVGFQHPTEPVWMRFERPPEF